MDARVVENFAYPVAMYLLCDGHQGVACAKFTVDLFYSILIETLPKEFPNFDDRKETEDYADKVRHVLAEICVNIDNEWSKIGKISGCTLTVVVVTGWLISAANVGDSIAALDVGSDFMELTHSHRLQVNKTEVKRCETGGGFVAPLGFHLQGPAKPNEMGVGPLRLWPGGLCVSRSIGDLDAGPLVVPIPHVKQMYVPQHGCRVIVASDGLWDIIQPRQALKLVRNKGPQDAADFLVLSAARDRRFSDDITIIVADILPNANIPFAVQALRNASVSMTKGRTPSIARSLTSPSATSAAGEKTSSGGLFSCFAKPKVVEHVDSQEVFVKPSPSRSTGPIDMIADEDTLTSIPAAKTTLARMSIPLPPLPNVSATRPETLDYTVHGAVRPRLFGEGGAATYKDYSVHAGDLYKNLGQDITYHGGDVDAPAGPARPGFVQGDPTTRSGMVYEALAMDTDLVQDSALGERKFGKSISAQVDRNASEEQLGLIEIGSAPEALTLSPETQARLMAAMKAAGAAKPPMAAAT